MKAKYRGAFLFLLFAVAMFAPAASALPLTGTVSGWGPNSVSFQYSHDGRTIEGWVDYAVYDDYPGNILSGEQYVYVYQIFNSGLSDVDIESLSIGILDDADVGIIGYDGYGVPGGTVPTYSYFSPGSGSAQSAVYLFLPTLIGEGVIEDGDESVLLVFTSVDGPTDGFGIIQGGGIGTMVEHLPTPVPEPATVILLGIGSAFLAVTGRRKTG